MLLAEVIADAGYEVREAGSGDEALAMLKTLDPPLKIVVTDVQMPGWQDGLALGLHVRQHHPHVPVIYMTGRPDLLQHLATLNDRQAIVPKPFIPDEIVRKLRRCSPMVRSPDDTPPLWKVGSSGCGVVRPMSGLLERAGIFR